MIEAIYTNKSTDNEVEYYVIETILKAEVPPCRQKNPSKRTKRKPILSDDKIVWRLNPIWLETELFSYECEYMQTLV